MIECGFCPIRNLSQAIILRQYETEMLFHNLEWINLIEELQKLYIIFLTTEAIDANLHPPVYIGDFITIKTMLLSDVKEIMLMQCLTGLYLSDSNIN